MLYDTLSQFPFLCLLFVAGFLCGFVFDLKKLLIKDTKQIFLGNLFDFFAITTSFVLLFFINLKQHYGIFRLFPLVWFISSLAIERLLSKKCFAFLFQKCYNHFIRKRNERHKK